MAFETISLFDELENDQTMQRDASRRALALAHNRVEHRLGSFFRGAQSEEEFEARLALVLDDFNHYVDSSAEEIGYDTPQHIRASILEHYRTASDPGETCPNCGKPGGCDHGHKVAAEPVEFNTTPEQSEEDGDAAAEKTSAFKWSLDSFTSPGQPSGSASIPPNGNLMGAPATTPPVPNAATSVNPQAGGAATQVGQPDDPYAQQAMQQQNQVPAQMPTPTFASSEKKFSPADQKVDEGGASVLDALDESGPKTAHVWKVSFDPNNPWADDPSFGRDKGFSDQMLQQPPQDPAAQFGAQIPQQAQVPPVPQIGTPEYDQLQQNSVAPPGFQPQAAESGNTDLGGPEPKIDKDKQTGSNPKKEEESALEDSGRWPTKRKDPTEPIKPENREVDGKPNHTLKEIGEKTTESEKLPNNKGDAGFDDGGVNKGPHTKTFDGKGQVDPVTKPVFPDKSAVESAFRSLV
jgi:hypothetical protein